MQLNTGKLAKQPLSSVFYVYRKNVNFLKSKNKFGTKSAQLVMLAQGAPHSSAGHMLQAQDTRKEQKRLKLFL